MQKILMSLKDPSDRVRYALSSSRVEIRKVLVSRTGLTKLDLCLKFLSELQETHPAAEIIRQLFIAAKTNENLIMAIKRTRLASFAEERNHDTSGPVNTNISMASPLMNSNLGSISWNDDFPTLPWYNPAWGLRHQNPEQ
jgi:hypothetical protein